MRKQRHPRELRKVACGREELGFQGRITPRGILAKYYCELTR